MYLSFLVWSEVGIKDGMISKSLHKIAFFCFGFIHLFTGQTFGLFLWFN
jgi:hypothetical protein